MNPPLTERQILDMVTGSNAKIGAELSGSNGLPALEPLPSLSDAAGSIIKGFMLGGAAVVGGPGLASAFGATSSVAKTEAKSVGGFFALISDVPRMATIIVGAMLIAAGLFGLAGGKAIHIYQTLKP